MKKLNEWGMRYIGLTTLSQILGLGVLISLLIYGIFSGKTERKEQLENQHEMSRTIDSINIKIDHEIIDSLNEKLE